MKSSNSAADSSEPTPASTARSHKLDDHSPLHDAAAVYRASDQAQLTELAVTATLFINELVGIHRLSDTEFTLTHPYEHASIAETLDRARHGDTSVPEKRSTGDERPNPDSADPLPSFPKFSKNTTFHAWVHNHAEAQDISEFAALRATSDLRAYAHIIEAVTLVEGLPRFHRRCQSGEFTIEHIHVAIRLCRDVSFEYLPQVDEYLTNRRADVTIATFRTGLAQKIATIQPDDDRHQQAVETRGVNLCNFGNGVSALTLTGPTPDLEAFNRRSEGFARAIHAGNSATFGDQLPAGFKLDDSRGISALMFDIITRTIPQIDVRVTPTGDSAESSSATEHETDTTADICIPVSELMTKCRALLAAESSATEHFAGVDHSRINLTGSGLDDAADTGTAETGISATGIDPDAGTGTGTGIADAGIANIGITNIKAVIDQLTNLLATRHSRVVLTLPTSEQWLEAQSRTVVTVPALTLLGKSELPGTDAYGTPVPADTARRLAAHSKTWTRILTDPATGTPIDARARNYQISAAVRQTLHAQWHRCAMPGCRRRAETSEVDHVQPFNRSNPEQGGLTVFGNLLPSCKRHHQAKTDRRVDVAMPDSLTAEYTFGHGLTTTVHAPDNPINAAHARLFAELFAAGGIHPSPPDEAADATERTDATDTTGAIDTAGVAKPSGATDAADITGAAGEGKTDGTRTDRNRNDDTGGSDANNVDNAKTGGGGEHYIGERIVSEARPGPPPTDGRPGWLEYPTFFQAPGRTADDDPSFREWFWDSGSEPPF